MYSIEKIVWNLVDTGLVTKSKTAEITGLSVNEVHQILKNPAPEDDKQSDESLVHSDPECVFQFCPNPYLCRSAEDCQNKR